MGSLTSPPRVERMYVSGGSRDHRLFVIDAVRGRVSAANAALVEGLSFLRRAEEAGLGVAFRLDFARNLYDALGDLQGRNERDLDAENLDVTLYPIDLSELDVALAKMEAAIRAKAARLVPETTYTNGSAA